MKTQRTSTANSKMYNSDTNIHKKDIIMVQGDWNAKVRIDPQAY